MKERKIVAVFTEFSSSEELSSEEKELLTAAREAAKNAYAPYSKFLVGAAVLLQNGKIIAANNQENAAYPSGLCAERVAVFSAVAQNPGVAINSIAVTVNSLSFDLNNPVSPCGACRQVMAEYETYYQKEIKIIMAGSSGPVLVSNSIKNLLPLLFSASNLKQAK
ncbi:MAG: cytidine deaminase [Bacteroidia bacterium]